MDILVMVFASLKIQEKPVQQNRLEWDDNMSHEWVRDLSLKYQGPCMQVIWSANLCIEDHDDPIIIHNRWSQ